MNSLINYLLIFVGFLTISIILFIINILFLVYKKKKYSLFKTTIFILALFILSIIFLILGIPFFIISESKDMLETLEYYFFPIISYNISIILLGGSLTIFNKATFKVDEKIIKSLPPSRINSIKSLEIIFKYIISYE